MNLDQMLDELVDTGRQEIPAPERTLRVGKAVQAVTGATAASGVASQVHAAASASLQPLAHATASHSAVSATTGTAVTGVSGSVLAGTGTVTTAGVSTLTKLSLVGSLIVGGGAVVSMSSPWSGDTNEAAVAVQESAQALSQTADGVRGPAPANGTPTREETAPPPSSASTRRVDSATQSPPAAPASHAAVNRTGSTAASNLKRQPTRQAGASNDDGAQLRDGQRQAQQLALLLAARRSTHSDPARALALLDTLGTPTPSLLEQYLGVRLRALTAAGQPAEADRLREALLRHFPRSHYVQSGPSNE